MVVQEGLDLAAKGADIVLVEQDGLARKAAAPRRRLQLLRRGPLVALVHLQQGT